MALIFRVETLATVELELRSLVEDHWQEIVDDPDAMPLDIDWNLYRKAEADGQLFILTVRDEKLVGYVAHFIHRLPHYRWCLCARDDAHYLAPEYRKGGIGARMILEAERYLKLRGVEMISYHTKLGDLDRGPLFERLGYAATERIHVKRL